MAKILELIEPGWSEWVASRPPIIQDLCRRFPPDTLYRLEPGKSRVYILAYDEDGTMRVAVSGKYNACIFERQVFGVKPENMVECDLPSADEPLGAALVERHDIDEAIARMREEAACEGTD